MGSCVSTASTSSASVNPPATAKVITLTGALREYSFPVTASHALGADYPSCFLCNSDMLYYDDYIPVFDPEESLQLGQIYFVLPVSKLRYQLTGSEMAALAVKASSALALAASVKDGKGKKKFKISPVVETDEGFTGDGQFGGISNYNDKTSIQTMSQGKLAPKRKQRNMPIRGRIAFGSLRAKLNTIAEITE